MHRAKLLNRSGWKISILSSLLMTLVFLSAIGNAQQGTLRLTQGAARLKISRSATKESASQALQPNHSTNQQPQHRVSVAPQGGELGKKTGAYNYWQCCLVVMKPIALSCIFGATAGERCYAVPATAPLHSCLYACDRPPWQIPVPKELR